MRRKIALIALIGALLFWPDHGAGQGSQHGSFLTWTAPSVDASHGPATSYNVYRSTTAGGPYTIVANVTTTSYVDPVGGLNTGTTYFYVIKTVNSLGVEGATSSEVSGLIPNVPGAVTALVDAVR